MVAFGAGLLGSVIYPLRFAFHEHKMETWWSHLSGRLHGHLVPMFLVDMPLGLIRLCFLYCGLVVSQYCLIKNVIVLLYTCAALHAKDDHNSKFLQAASWVVDRLPGASEAEAEVDAAELDFIRHQRIIRKMINDEHVEKKDEREALSFFDVDHDGNLSLKEAQAMLAHVTHLTDKHIEEGYNKILTGKGKVDVDDIIHSKFLRRMEKEDRISCGNSMTQGSPLPNENSPLLIQDARHSPEEVKKPFVSPEISPRVRPLRSGKAAIFDFVWPWERGQGGVRNTYSGSRSCDPDRTC